MIDLCKGNVLCNLSTHGDELKWEDELKCSLKTGVGGGEGGAPDNFRKFQLK